MANFDLLMLSGISYALAMLGYFVWRFGISDAISFAIIAGGFSASLDFISSFADQNYVYPGRSQLWVFTYVFFGWIAICGICLLLAEGIVCRRDEDMLTRRAYLWQLPLVTGVIALLFDLFLDPVAVAAGYWVWLKEANVYYGIPLLNFVGWFLLMGLASFGWISIARQRVWGPWRKVSVALLAMLPLGLCAGVLSILLNGLLNSLGLK